MTKNIINTAYNGLATFDQRAAIGAPVGMRRELVQCETSDDVAEFLADPEGDVQWRYRLAALEGRFLTAPLIAELCSPAMRPAARHVNAGFLLAYNFWLPRGPAIRPFIDERMRVWRTMRCDAERGRSGHLRSYAGEEAAYSLTLAAARGCWHRRDDHEVAEEIDFVAGNRRRRPIGWLPALQLATAFRDSSKRLVARCTETSGSDMAAVLMSHPKQTTDGFDRVLEHLLAPFRCEEAASWASPLLCGEAWTRIVVAMCERCPSTARVFVAHQLAAILESLAQVHRRSPTAAMTLLEELPAHVLRHVPQEVLINGLMSSNVDLRQACLQAIGARETRNEA